MFCFLACKNNSHDSLNHLFSKTEDIIINDFNIGKDNFAQIEGLQSNDSMIITLDYHSGESFSLYNSNRSKLIGRFGLIGQGPNEIPLGTYGYVEGDNFFTYYEGTGYLANYKISSLEKDLNSHPEYVVKYTLPDAQLSRIVSLDDSMFLGAGTYDSKFQYVLFDRESNVIDYAIDIFNADEIGFNHYHKFLSNQGILRKNPANNKFVYSIYYSSNIDFIEVKNNKIFSLKSIRLKDPVFNPIQDNGLNRVIPSDDNFIGYLDISPTEEYIYALYTDRKIKDNNKYNDYDSDIILVFDWDGNPIKRYKLSERVRHISVNERQKRLYVALIDDENHDWDIRYCNLK